MGQWPHTRRRSSPPRLLLTGLLSAFALAASGCQTVVAFFASPTPTPTDTPTPTATSTSTPTPTLTPTPTATPTITPTPTITDTPTITPSPTFDFPDATVNQQAHCRYGPNKNYLHAGDLYAGDHGVVWNRNSSATWLWVRFDKLWYACWVAASVVDVDGDVHSVSVIHTKLPHSTLYGPPKGVQATRQGDEVTVTWNKVSMTVDDDRGYMIEANVCQDGHLIFVVAAMNDTSYTFNDEGGCSNDSSGKLYTVEKHGYTDPVTIPWPD
jgi:hypothetical protein